MSLPGYAGPWLSRCKSVRPPRPNIGIRLACAESLQVLFDNQMSSSSNGSPTLATETYAREHNPPSKAQSVVELWLFFAVEILVFAAVERARQPTLRQWEIARGVSQAFIRVYFFHVNGENGQRGMCALSLRHRGEADTTVFGSRPYPTDQFGGDANKPGIGVVVGGTGLSAHRVADVVAESDTPTRSGIYHALQHIDHDVCALTIQYLGHLGRMFIDRRSVLVLDAQ